MKEWLRISCLLCVFGFFREIRPSEPFITEFLVGPWRNITEEQINRDVFPVGTYAYGAQLVLVFLVTDFLRYKPLIIVAGLSGIGIWSLLLWTTSLEALQLLEIFYGAYMASEVAYYTYIYAKVDKKYYQRVTSHTRAATLSGKLVGSVLSQILVNFKLMDYRELNYISLATQICATCWAFLLPKVPNSLYFHRNENLDDLVKNEEHCDGSTNSIQQLERKQIDRVEVENDGAVTVQKNNSLNKHKKLLSDKTVYAFRLLWSQFCNAYTNTKVLQWSLWYAVGLCGQLQILSYIQLLWKSIEKNPTVIWNAAVDAVLTFLGTIFALLAGYLKIGPKGNLLLLATLSILQGLSLLLASWTTVLYVSYISYISYGSLYAFTITIASSEVAKHLEEESFGLVFGINTLFAVILQSILTLIVVSKDGLALDVIQQFTVYSFYYIVIGVVFLLNVLVEYSLYTFRHSKTEEIP